MEDHNNTEAEPEPEQEIDSENEIMEPIILPLPILSLFQFITAVL